jgi:hypothetical protein
MEMAGNRTSFCAKNERLMRIWFYRIFRICDDDPWERVLKCNLLGNYYVLVTCHPEYHAHALGTCLICHCTDRGCLIDHPKTVGLWQPGWIPH